MPLFLFLRLYIFLYVWMRVFSEKGTQQTRTWIAALYRWRILFDRSYLMHLTSLLENLYLSAGCPVTRVCFVFSPLQGLVWKVHKKRLGIPALPGGCCVRCAGCFLGHKSWYCDERGKPMFRVLSQGHGSPLLHEHSTINLWDSYGRFLLKIVLLYGCNGYSPKGNTA